MRRQVLPGLILLLLCSAFTTLSYYPIDGYEKTGIKRLKRLELIKNGEIKDATALPPGAMKSYSEIELNLRSRAADSVAALMTVDEDFQKEINGLFKGLDKATP